MSDETPAEGDVISFADAAARKVPPRTVIDNSRRFSPESCNHKGPFIVDSKLERVECGDCGAHLSPHFVLKTLAAHEAYYNQRSKDLTAYLKEVKAELEGRARTKCTHCGNMTAIKFNKEAPRTWFRPPDP